MIAQADVVDVEQDLVLALLVPYLPSGVAGVGQDRLDGALGPSFAGAVAVTGGVGGRRGRDAVTGQCLGDSEDPGPGQIHSEDSSDDRRGDGVGLEPVQTLAVGGLARVRVRAGVGEAVAVRRTAAKEPSLDLGLCLHRHPHTDLDPGTLALGHPAEHAHDQIVGLGVRIDSSADLGHPEFDTVVGEHRHGEAVLVAVEGTLRLADHDRAEAPVGICEGLQQCSSPGAAAPRQGAGHADVEELGYDLSTDGFNQCGCPSELPVLGGFRVLVVFG
ncbi:hypothetical protein BG844_07985 [Couchioplanes caeruleus subsp. caeruleus]|uniref:Uncharacterized protein n=1 Tax=Couchioplanes caeruleus subsp. caeruleus TaxID=56427 RepID=A0A1K0FPI9_9ACTN|nr:hypothetical protein BG844_07985 [Couchioplanes caeruleus subsp. caeruleus]